MTSVPFVDLSAQYRSIAEDVRAAMDSVLTGSTFILGPQVGQFEDAFAGFVGVAHAVGVSSGLDALRLSLMAVDVRAGDEVILPANTFIATALAVSALGACPILVDCDPGSYNIAIEAIEPAVTDQTRAIIPVHLTGLAADMDAIVEIARRYHLPVIEDAAQAHGARYKDRACGSLGTTGCFSFYPSKNLGAYGDGGIVTTNDPKLAERLRALRDYGQTVKNIHAEKGVNARLDTLQAAVLSVKLHSLPAWNQARLQHAQYYRELLAGTGDLIFQDVPSYSTHVYHLFVIETADRDALREHLARYGIQTGVHYPTPIHLQPAFSELGYGPGDFPAAERLAKQSISLPMFPELTRAQIEYVSERIRDFFFKRARPVSPRGREVSPRRWAPPAHS